ncbi:uncharacterized protein LOC107044197 [Diachasma alloeum]|uniref:uncharacterized protein LOC107044197 n=1 Tax=Diachasma alloeum TaxID=454923 RepID=UPI0007384A49|nr:uncharacterized protein LOC107044197 [Diachasma alloeum]
MLDECGYIVTTDDGHFVFVHPITGEISLMHINKVNFDSDESEDDDPENHSNAEVTNPDETSNEEDDIDEMDFSDDDENGPWQPIRELHDSGFQDQLEFVDERFPDEPDPD